MYASPTTRTEGKPACRPGKADHRRSRRGQVAIRKTAFDLSGDALRTDILRKYDLTPSRYGWRSFTLADIRRLKDEAEQFARSQGISLPEGRYNLDGVIDTLNSDSRIEIKLIETDQEELLLCKKKIYEQDTLFWLQVRPTFEEMSPEMGRLVRGVFTRLSQHHGFMDLTDWFANGYGEYWMEGIEDSDCEEEEREFIDYLESSKNGLIMERMTEAFRTNVKIDEILEYKPSSEEKELHDILLEGIPYISSCPFSLTEFLLENEDIDYDFTIESSLRFALTYDIDDRISSDMLNGINEDECQGGYMCPVGEWNRINSYNRNSSQIETFLEWLHKLSSKI